ncbi:hypothetical protein BO71DRAFT_427330 [Aspergillus ellipticus CBS 707.79]|uniref:Uncharacterized protein n=1 Tax=Aspergillus ellipticus CBS 707.79 TaxID=1448320 RepID=A0A319DI14_9EURO|nr:hypothetical protein BO71DRAFT_427330 [Aspergillus ellipticus CBS 707.79]
MSDLSVSEGSDSQSDAAVFSDSENIGTSISSETPLEKSAATDGASVTVEDVVEELNINEFTEYDAPLLMLAARQLWKKRISVRLADGPGVNLEYLSESDLPIETSPRRRQKRGVAKAADNASYDGDDECRSMSKCKKHGAKRIVKVCETLRERRGGSSAASTPRDSVPSSSSYQKPTMEDLKSAFFRCDRKLQAALDAMYDAQDLIDEWLGILPDE